MVCCSDHPLDIIQAVSYTGGQIVFEIVGMLHTLKWDQMPLFAEMAQVHLLNVTSEVPHMCLYSYSNDNHFA